MQKYRRHLGGKNTLANSAILDLALVEAFLYFITFITQMLLDISILKKGNDSPRHVGEIQPYRSL